MYLYIFEDGETCQLESPPTEHDFTAMADGLLQILVFKDGSFQHFGIEQCVLVARGVHVKDEVLGEFTTIHSSDDEEDDEEE
jgi:hypothetical protein